MMQYFTFKKSFQAFALLLLNIFSNPKVTLVGASGEIFQSIQRAYF